MTTSVWSEEVGSVMEFRLLPARPMTEAWFVNLLEALTDDTAAVCISVLDSISVTANSSSAGKK